VNNTPLSPPAERYGLSLIALIRAIAAQAGWVVPRWLVAKVEAEIWGFVEALSLLVAVVKQANLAAAAAEPAPQPVQGTNTKARHRGTARSGRRAAIGRIATRSPEARGQEAAAPRHPRPSAPHPQRQNRRRPGRHATVSRPRSGQPPPHRKTAYAKPTPWRAQNVTMTE